MLPPKFSLAPLVRFNVERLAPSLLPLPLYDRSAPPAKFIVRAPLTFSVARCLSLLLAIYKPPVKFETGVPSLTVRLTFWLLSLAM